MRPVEIPDHDLEAALDAPFVKVVYGADQEEYRPLPAVVLREPEGRVITRWQPTEDERRAIMDGACIELCLATFNGPLQPLLVGVQGVQYVPDELGPRRAG